MNSASSQPIFHLVPADYYHRQPKNKPYQPETFADEGFIHCTAGQEMLIEVANRYFETISGDLLALHVDPQRLTSPLKFELPIPPPGESPAGVYSQSDVLFPHIYGPVNRDAIINCVTLQRDEFGRWYYPE